MYFKSCRFDLNEKFSSKTDVGLLIRGHGAGWILFLCGQPGRGGTSSSPGHQQTWQVSNDLKLTFLYIFFWGRLVKDVFEQFFIICSTFLIMDVHDQLKWMVKVLKMMIKVLKLLFFFFLRITFPW